MTSTSSAATRVAGINHLVETILRYATKSTQVTCLRVSHTFFLASGRSLYHTVTISGKNMVAFFRGALGTEDKVKCPLARGLSSTCKAKPVERPEPNETPSPDIAPAVSTGTAVDKTKKRKSKLKSMSNSKKSKGKGKGKGKKRTADSNTPNQDTNFKTPLLACVRVLTITSHHWCPCERYGEAGLLPHVDTLRIAADIADFNQLHPLCDGDDMKMCSLVYHLTPRKVVFRNLDGNGLPLCWEYWPNAVVVEEAVYFFPTDGRLYASNHDSVFVCVGLLSIGGFLPDTMKVKIVFHSSWEGTVPAQDSFQSIFFRHMRAPVMLDDIIYPISNISTWRDTEWSVYGFERLVLGLEGDLMRTYQHFHPVAVLNQARLHEISKKELRTGNLSCSLGEDELQDEDFPEHRDYFNLREYISDTSNRYGELNAED